MDTFREAMAFLLMGTLVYLSSTLIKQIGQDFASVLWFMLVLSLAAWVWGRSNRRSRKKHWRIILKVLPVVFILLSAKILLNFERDNIGQREDSPYWEDFDPQTLNQMIEQGQPVFLAFSAEWCTSCKINERTVLHTKKVQDLFKAKGVRRIKGDLTLSNDMAMEWIYRYDRAGVPLYLLYLPGEEPLILPEILSYAILEEALESLP